MLDQSIESPTMLTKRVEKKFLGLGLVGDTDRPDG